MDHFLQKEGRDPTREVGRLRSYALPFTTREVKESRENQKGKLGKKKYSSWLVSSPKEYHVIPAVNS